MFKRIEVRSGEVLSNTFHKDYERHNTDVAEYFRKYSAGKSDQMPLDPRSQVSDQRPESEMLDDDSIINHMSCDDLDVLREMEEHRAEFEAAFKDIELTKTQRKQFEDATKILDDPNASLDQKREAYMLLDELKEKVTRARK